MTPPTIAMGSTVRQERMYLLDSRRGDWPEFSESLEPVLAPDGSLADRDDSLCGNTRGEGDICERPALVKCLTDHEAKVPLRRRRRLIERHGSRIGVPGDRGEDEQRVGALIGDSVTERSIGDLDGHLG